MLLPTMAWQGERYWLEPLVRGTGAQPLADTVLEVRWRPAPALHGVAGGGAWLVVGSGGDADDVAEALRTRGCSVACSPRVPAEVEADGVIYLGGLEVDATDVLGGQERLVAEALELVQRAIVGRGQLWFVTPGIFRGDDPSAVSAAALWGLGRVVAVEQPGCWGGSIDVEGRLDAAALVERVLGGRGVYRIRHGSVLEGRLGPARGALADPPPLGETWLITGGFGDLGRRTARWLIEHGVKRLCIVSRSGPASPEARALVAELRGRRVKVVTVERDVGAPSLVR